MPRFDPPRVLVIPGRCDPGRMVDLLRDCVLTVATSENRARLSDEFFHDIELIETHLNEAEWKIVQSLPRKGNPNMRLHLCMANPDAVKICRIAIENYRRDRERNPG